MSNNTIHGIYVVSNPTMPGLLKIGFTKNTIGQRLAQLNTTGVPAPFRCEAFFSCNRLELVESRIHSDLEKFRYRDGREFFKISVEEATTVARKHAARYPRNINDPPEKLKTKKELAREKSQALLKAIENAKTCDEVDRLEKELRYYYVKGVDELGGKGEFEYLKVMANARSLNIRKEQKKKEEERKSNETKQIIKKSNKIYVDREKDQKEVREGGSKGGKSNTDTLCLIYIFFGCMVTGYLSADLNLFSRSLILPFCMFFVVTGFLYKYKNSR